jgi:hypothetical protein
MNIGPERRSIGIQISYGIVYRRESCSAKPVDMTVFRWPYVEGGSAMNSPFISQTIRYK